MSNENFIYHRADINAMLDYWALVINHFLLVLRGEIIQPFRVF